ncbi:MAG: hypothetical protein FWD74_09995 [Actinomycetia bacterium]|nr:hypothetical protein [Actinomycetes bacterium]
MRSRSSLVVIALAAMLIVLTGCGHSPAPAPLASAHIGPVNPQCASVRALDETALQQAAANVSDTLDLYAPIKYTANTLVLADFVSHFLPLNADSQAKIDADTAAVISALQPVTECADIQVQTLSFDSFSVLAGLDAADMTLEIGDQQPLLGQSPQDDQEFQSSAIESLGHIPGLKSLTLSPYGYLVSLNQLPSMPTVTSLTVRTLSSTVDFSALATKTPNLTELGLEIASDATWTPTDIASLAQLTAITFDTNNDLTKPRLDAVSKETFDLIAQTPAACPNIKTINGEPASAVSELVDSGALQSGQEIADQNAITQLSSWGIRMRQAKYAKHAAVSQIAGPALVFYPSSTDDTTHAPSAYLDSAGVGVRGGDFYGIPATDLCKDTADCKSVVVIGFRVGAVSGHYVPVGPDNQPVPGSGIDGNYGETTVTIYDLTGQWTTTVVAVRTAPATRVQGYHQPIGEPAFTGACDWIAKHIK